MSSAPTAPDLDADDAIAIQNLFHEPGDDNVEGDASGGPIGPQNKPSQNNDSSNGSSMLDLMDDNYVKHEPLKYRVEIKDMKVLDNIKILVEATLCEDNKNQNILQILKNIFKEDPYAVFVASSYITTKLITTTHTKDKQLVDASNKNEKIIILRNLFVNLIEHDDHLSLPVYIFIESSLKQLVRSCRFEELEFISIHLTKYLIAFLSKLYMIVQANVRLFIDDTNKCQSFKNAYDLFSSLIMWHQHSPIIIENIKVDINTLFKKFPTMDIEKTWLKIDKTQVMRPSIWKKREIKMKNVNSNKINHSNSSSSNNSQTAYTFIKSPRVKIGKQLCKSGINAWVSLPAAIELACASGYTPGYNLFYIQRLENKVYFYDKGDENGVSGADNWAFQSDCSNSTNNCNNKIVSLRDAETKEERTSIIRQRMQKGVKSPSMLAQMAQIQNMGFTDLQAYAALKTKGGNVEQALDFLLTLTDEEKEKLGEDIDDNTVDGDNQHQGVSSLDSESPDTPDDETKSDDNSNNNNNNNSKYMIGESSNNSDCNRNVTIVKEFWCFERNIILMFKSLLVLFRGYKKTCSSIKAILMPFQSVVHAPTKYPLGNNYEIEEIKDEEVKIKDGKGDKCATFFEGFSNETRNTILPPWFEGFYHSGVGENAPGSAMIIKAMGQQFGSTLSGTMFDTNRNIDFDFQGVSYIVEDNNVITNTEKPIAKIEGVMKSSTEVEPLALLEDRESGLLTGWHVKNGKYSALYGRKCISRQSTSIKNISNGKNMLNFFSNYNTASETTKNAFLYVLANPILPKTNIITGLESLTHFEINTTICVPSIYNKSNVSDNLIPQSVNDNSFPEILCGLICLESCGIALTKQFNVVAWSLCKPKQEDVNVTTNIIETNQVERKKAQSKPELTVDLKMMVDAEMITIEQAYGMMGVDSTPKADPKTNATATNTTGSTTSRDDNGNQVEDEIILSFIETPNPLNFDAPCNVKFIQTDSFMKILIDNVSVVEKKTANENDGLWFLEKESREKKRSGNSGDIPGVEIDVKSTFTRLPQYATTIAVFSSENPLFNFIKMKDDALLPFQGALFETTVSVKSNVKSYWPLSSEFIGVDCSGNGQHLTVTEIGCNDLRNSWIENYDINCLFNYSHENNKQNIRRMSRFIYHSSIKNLYRLSGFASVEDGNILFSNKGYGAVWLSHRHSVTGGFDLCCKMNITKTEGKENNDFSYTLVLRKASLWISNPLETFDDSNLTVKDENGLLDEYRSFWNDKDINGLSKEAENEKETKNMGFMLSEEQKKDDSVVGRVRKLLAEGLSQKIIFKKMKREMGITDYKEIMKILKKATPPNENRSPLESLDELDIDYFKDTLGISSNTKEDVEQTAEESVNNTPVGRAKLLLADGLDQAAAMKILRKDGLTIPDAMQALQKALSQNFVASSKEELAIADDRNKKKKELAMPVSIYFKVLVHPANGATCDVFLVLVRGEETKIIFSVRNVWAKNALQPSLIYRQKTSSASQSHFCIFFGKDEIARVHFDLSKEVFLNLQDDTNDGMWIGLLREAIKPRECKIDNCDGESQYHSFGLRLNELEFCGISSRDSKNLKGNESNALSSASDSIDKEIKETFAKMYPSKGFVERCHKEPICIIWGGVESLDTVIQPLDEIITIRFNAQKLGSILTKNAWIGVYDASKAHGDSDNRFLSHFAIKPYMCQDGMYVVQLPFSSLQPQWLEIRLFKDVTNDGFVAASGIYRFDKKAPCALSNELRREQNELFKYREAKYMRLTLMQRDFYYKSYLTRVEHQKLEMKTKKAILGYDLESNSDSVNNLHLKSKRNDRDETTPDSTSSYLKCLVDTYVAGKDFSETKLGVGNISGEWHMSSGGRLSINLNEDAEIDDTIVPIFPVKCTFRNIRQSSEEKLPREIYGVVVPKQNTKGRHWQFQGTWLQVDKIIPHACYWNYDGAGDKACGKWFRDGNLSGKWTLKKQMYNIHFRSDNYYSGLINMSDDLVNVCYQNSVIQCLYNSEFFREKLFEFNEYLSILNDVDENNEVMKLSIEEQSAIKLLHGLKHLYGQLTYSQRVSHASHDLQKEITKVFEKGRQQDSHAFLVYLLDNLNTALEKIKSVYAEEYEKDVHNFVKASFEGNTGIILKRRDTGLTWVTNQDVFTNLSVVLPQRYAPITKIAILSQEDLEKKAANNDGAKGYEILDGEITADKKNLTKNQKLYIAIYRGEKYGRPITKLKVLIYGDDDGIVVPDGYHILMRNLNPVPPTEKRKCAAKKVYLAYQQGTNSVPIVEMSTCIGGKKAKVPNKDFIRLNEPLNGQKGYNGTYCYLAYKKDSTAVRELCLGDGVSKSLERNFTKLDINICGVGNYETAVSEMSKQKKSLSKVNFSNKNVRETYEGGPDRVTSGTWGIYVAGKKEMQQIGFANKDLNEGFKRLKHLQIGAIVNVATDSYECFNASYGDHFQRNDPISGLASWKKNIEEILQFISTQKILKRNVLIIGDDRNIAAAIFLIFFMRTKHWKLLKSWKFLLSRLHKTSRTNLPEFIWEYLLQFEITTLPNMTENSMTWDIIKGESGKGTRKSDRQKFNVKQASKITSSKDLSDNNTNECNETKKDAVSLTLPGLGEIKTGEYQDKSESNKEEETTVVVVDDTKCVTNQIDETTIKKQFMYVSYGGKEKVITGIEMVSGSKEAREKDLELCCKFDEGKYLAVRRGEGCPVINVQLFKAPNDIPRFQGFEVLDLISLDFDEEKPMVGLWKPKKEDKLNEILNFTSNTANTSSNKILVHGTTESGATLRGLLTTESVEQSDISNNPECIEDNFVRWTIDGVKIDDSRIEPFKMSYFSVNGYRYLDQNKLCSCMKESDLPSFGLPLTGIKIITNTSDPKVTEAGWIILRHTLSGNSIANFGSDTSPAFLCVRYGGNFPSISKVFVVWNGIENIPSTAVAVEGNLNATQIGSGPEVILCYNTVAEDEVSKRTEKKSNKNDKNKIRSIVMSIGISKDNENTQGYSKKSTTDSLAMNASFNQNPAFSNFYLCVKMGDAAPKKQMKHPINGTYAYGGAITNNDSISGGPAGDSGSSIIDIGRKFSLYATEMVQCLPAQAEYQLWRPKSYRGKLCGWMFREIGRLGIEQWTMFSNYETKRNKGAAIFSIDTKFKTCEGLFGKEGNKVSLVRDSYLKLGFQRDYMSDWANGVEVFSGRCRGNRIDDMLAQDVSVLGGKNAWRDENGVAREVTRTAVVVNSPQNLIVHVNRSKWDVEKGQLVKDNRSIEFDPVLELPGKSDSWPEEIKNMSKSSFSKKSRRYGLYGIVVHSGTTANSGHYYAYARQSNAVDLHLRESPSSPWFCYNDTNIKLTKWSTMTSDIKRKKNHSAYLLFYKKIELKVDNDNGKDFVDGNLRDDFQQFCVDNNREEILNFLKYTKSNLYDEWLRNDLMFILSKKKKKT
jgi:ubiquitin C-terminal hydrolase